MDRFDLLVVVGLAAVLAGLYFIYWPLVLVGGGLFVMIVGVFGAWTKSKKDSGGR